MFKQILVFTLLLVTVSCSDDDKIVEQVITCDDGIRNGDENGIDCGGICFANCLDENALEGFLVTRRILSADIEYKLTGPYIVRDGAELEIEAGTVIKAVPNSDAYIAVAQGGKLFVLGNANAPVVITSDSDNPQPGDWGGVIICGQAPTNNGINARSDLGDIFYGGTNTGTSSGNIRYLRLEYTGALFRNEFRFNALTFYGVGSFTDIQNIQAYESLGNGFEIFGGNITATNLVSLNVNQFGVKASGGWNGSGTSWFLSNQTNVGIYMGNNALDFTAEPMSNVIIENVSIIDTFSNSGLFYTDGGGNFELNNIYIAQVGLGINIDTNFESIMVDDGNLVINNIEFDNPTPNFMETNYTGSASFYSQGITNGSGNRNTLPFWAEGWTIGF
ncbi:hypothetical protein [Winogradskyella sp. PE311]|uniref:hypothetical protein n=1 Tax=Winogradskyella sp. PE311 TaxID=3366943 RepID=UPI00397F8133